MHMCRFRLEQANDYCHRLGKPQTFRLQPATSHHGARVVVNMGAPDAARGTGDGADILSICGKKVHVLWNWWDMALLGRRALNSGRRALGKVGDEGKQGDGKLIADASTLVYRESNDLNKQVKGFVNRRTGHGYQAVDGALDYYLAEL